MPDRRGRLPVLAPHESSERLRRPEPEVGGDSHEWKVREEKAFGEPSPALFQVIHEAEPSALEPAPKCRLGDASAAGGQARPKPDKEDRHLFGEEGELLALEGIRPSVGSALEALRESVELRLELKRNRAARAEYHSVYPVLPGQFLETRLIYLEAVHP